MNSSSVPQAVPYFDATARMAQLCSTMRNLPSDRSIASAR